MIGQKNADDHSEHPEAREAKSQRMKEYYADPKNRESASKRTKKYYADHPEAREAASRKMKKSSQRLKTMFKNLTIKNFQSYQQADIQFSTGLTVFTGSSNSGKTSLLRALNWLVFNRPRGDGIIRHGTKQASATLELGGGEIIRRTKGDNTNEYHLNDQRFTALNANIPDQIIDLLNIGPENVQDQFSPYFLIHDPPGKIFRAFESSIGTGSGQNAIVELSSQIKALKSALEHEKTREDGLRREIADFLDLVPIAEEVALADDMECIIEESETELTILERFLDDLDSIEKEQDKLKKSSIDKQLVETLEALANELQELIRQKVSLEVFLNDIIYIENEQDKLYEVSIDLHLVEQTEFLANELLNLFEQDVALGALIDGYSDIDEEMKSQKTRKENAEVEYNKLLSEISICPSCGQFLNEKAKKQLLGEEA